MRVQSVRLAIKNRLLCAEKTRDEKLLVETSGVKATGDVDLDRVRAGLSGPGVIRVNFLNDAERIQNARH
jgi:hypothetical protein